jgi:hypothetical protein
MEQFIEVDGPVLAIAFANAHPSRQ